LPSRLSTYDLQPRQARVIDAIARQEPISQIVLAKMFDVTPASMSVMLSRMEKTGLIERSPEPSDARSFRVVLSSHGWAALDIIKSTWATVDHEIETAIGLHDANELHRISLHLRKALGGQAPYKKETESPESSISGLEQGGASRVPRN
jgi:DNA-binding MarR family transcriptional regulator